MKFDLKSILILVLLIGIALMIFLWPKTPPSEQILKANDSIAQLLEANTINSMRTRTAELALVEFKAKKKSDSSRFKAIISTYEKNMHKKRTQVQTLIDSVPDLREFVEVADNVIELQRQRIDSLEAEKQFQAALYQDLIYVSNKKISNLNMIIAQKDIVIKDLQKQARRKRRGNKVLKVLAVTGTIGGLLLGSQL